MLLQASGQLGRLWQHEQGQVCLGFVERVLGLVQWKAMVQG